MHKTGEKEQYSDRLRAQEYANILGHAMTISKVVAKQGGWRGRESWLVAVHDTDIRIETAYHGHKAEHCRFSSRCQLNGVVGGDTRGTLDSRVTRISPSSLLYLSVVANGSIVNRLSDRDFPFPAVQFEQGR